MEAAIQSRESGRSRLESLRRFMARRDFVASREELVAHGFPGHQIDNWIKSERLTQVFLGVYSFGRDVESRQSALRAALLAAGPGAVLGGRTACEQHGILESGSKIPAYIEVATRSGRPTGFPGKSPAMRKSWVKVVRRDLSPHEVTTIDGLATAIPTLALIDLAVKAPGWEVRSAFLEACRLDLFGREEVDDCFRRASYRRGAKKLKPLLALWVPSLNRVKSVFEGDVLLRLLARRHPEPEVNVKVFGREVDLYWRPAKFGLELDGGQFHRDPLSKARDEEKTAYLRSRGVDVMRVSHEDFYADPERILDEVEARAGLV